MALLKLPCDVQSMLCASSQINSYARAVEELVYNSLDARSTSIAIRVHIDESSIQVVDNGEGIRKRDSNLLGLRYMTSKCVDVATLKSEPDKNGYRGESLANIIQVSQTVKIIARHENKEETWLKGFVNGKEREKVVQTKTRPSKGTTVEIKGFLHNLHIQKKGMNALNEMQSIKSFLERLSLAHSNISISLRDDSTNEIVFKLHKQRDVFQTLSSLFGIERNDIQELKVEKGFHRVTGLIGKTDRKIGKHWIFLNAKFVHSCKLHKVLNENFTKYMCTEPIKKYVRDDSEYALLKSNIPFYFIFLTCPYFDYELSCTGKKTVLEFKNWEQIKKLLEKLIKFYVGDINLKEVKKPDPDGVKEVIETRNDVKRIVDRVFNPNSNNFNIPQRGIKGKIIKRKNKGKSTHIPKICLSKIVPPKQLTLQSVNPVNHALSQNLRIQLNNDNMNNDFNKIKDTRVQKKDIISPNTEVKGNKARDISNKPEIRNELCTEVLEQNVPIHKYSRRALKSKQITETKKRKSYNQYEYNHNSVMRKFINPTASFKRRYKIITRDAEDALNNGNMNLRKFYEAVWKKGGISRSRVKINENNYKIKDAQNHNLPIPSKFERRNVDKHVWGLRDKGIKTTYDLIHTLLPSQRDFSSDLRNNVDAVNLIKERQQFKTPHKKKFQPKIQCISQFTFESHNYNTDITLANKRNAYININYNKNIRNGHFITKQSRDNFDMPIKQGYSKAFGVYQNGAKIYNNFEETSYTIEVTQNNQDSLKVPSNNLSVINECNERSMLHTNINLENINTYTILSTQKSMNILTKFTNSNMDKHYDNCNNTYYKIKPACESNSIIEDVNYERNVIFFSKSQSCKSDDKAINIPLDPLNMVETILTNDESNPSKKSNDKSNIFLSGRLSNLSEASNPKYKYHKENELLSTGIVSYHFEPSDACKAIETVINQNVAGDKNILDNADQSHIKRQNSPTNTLYPMLRENELNVEEITVEDNKFHKQSILGAKHNVLTDDISDEKYFYLKNRPRFLPKGMSQIFVNCNSKSVCDYNLDEDYFDESMYNDFARKVQQNSELFEPRIGNMNSFTTKDIEKVSNKLKKDNASLIFNGQSLKDATILGQVDEKFIAAVMKGKRNEIGELSNFLILFDQHAVHERIRLERNLSEYIDSHQWKSAPVDAISLKLSSDDIVYLHNFNAKFAQFGLQWTIINNIEVSITAIPAAILGKKARQVDKIMLAVKNLIAEALSILKLQKGCLSLYPKTIMDLVFSEACRYAIKFGDKLSLNKCSELLKQLSECKTPFQCAHGRPAMAVLMEYKYEDRKYQVNIEYLRNFKKNKK